MKWNPLVVYAIIYIRASPVVLQWRIHLQMQEMQDKRGSIPGSGRSLGGGNGNPLQYSGLGNPMDRGAWRATVHRVTKSQTQLNRLSKHAHIIYIGLRLRLILQNSSVMIQNHSFFLDKDSASFSCCGLTVTAPRPGACPGWVWAPSGVCRLGCAGASCCADPSFTLRCRSHAGSLRAPV